MVVFRLFELRNANERSTKLAKNGKIVALSNII